MTPIGFGTAKVWRSLEEGKMAGIAEGVSRGYRETSEAEATPSITMPSISSSL